MRLDIGSCCTSSVGRSTGRGGGGGRGGDGAVSSVEEGNCFRMSNKSDEAGTFGEHHLIG